VLIDHDVGSIITDDGDVQPRHGALQTLKYELLL
jgi:hypothetical protein